ncbi:MAG: hypothetical protein ACNS60_17585 [Candidatus Cyclobacteriaceae bacterium M2_1C_046]
MDLQIKRVFLIVFTFFQLTLFAQENIPLGTWRAHLSYKETHDIALLPNGIVAAAREGLFIYNEADGELQTINTLQGIHSSEITAVGYDDDNEIIFAGHISGAIDRIQNNEVVVIRSLLEDTRTSKAVNHFYSSQDKVYISTAIGLLVYNPATDLFSATYDGLGENGEDIEVFASVIFEDRIFAATGSTVLSGALQGQNLNDFRSWTRHTELPNGKAEDLAVAEDKLYVAIDDHDLFVRSEGEWNSTGLFPGADFESVSVSGSKLLVTVDDSVFTVENGQKQNIAQGIIKDPKEALQTEANIIYIADAGKGVIRISSGQSEVIVPSGPQIADINRMEVINEALYALPGQLSITEDQQGFATFSNGRWFTSTPAATNSQYQIPEVDNLYDVALFGGSLYFSSTRGGLLKLNENEKIVYKSGDGGIPFSEFNGKTILTGLAVTEEGLWVANYGSANPLHLFNGSTWQSFNLPYPYIADITRTPNGLLVLRLDPARASGIVVFNPDTGGSKFVSEGFPSGKVNDIVFDRDEKLWIATDKGLAYIPSLYNVFSGGEIKAIVPVFQNNLILRNINVTALAVDGGNRLWAGSNQGAWLFNADLDEQIYFFNEENSPLLNDRIEDIMLLQKTGEVFFATANGLISFRTASSTPALAEERVKIFPNPVTPEFQGSLGISGITSDAIVKITDEAGNIVFETRANGSTASWDLITLNGREVSTGIYLVFSSAADGSDTLVGKIAIIR